MKGIHHIDVSNKWAKYHFDLCRNITLITGDSGTGKTTLFRMIADHAREGKASGVHLSSDIPCVALTDSDWEHQLQGFQNSIVFVDEDSRFINSKEFARSVNGSDNYYVLITRDVLHELPYSVDEIYEIQTKGKKHTLRKKYSSGKAHIYTPMPSLIRYQVLLTEDSHSGFEFYKAHTTGTSVLCKSAESNSKIYSWINKNHDKTVLVIADGAAFGSEMNRIMLMAEKFPDTILLCLPESFEWLILKSDLLKSPEINKILENPSTFIESSQFISWEQFFTDLLIRETAESRMPYKKSKLDPFFLIPANREKIIAEIREVFQGV